MELKEMRRKEHEMQIMQMLLPCPPPGSSPYEPWQHILIIIVMAQEQLYHIATSSNITMIIIILLYWRMFAAVNSPMSTD